MSNRRIKAVLHGAFAASHREPVQAVGPDQVALDRYQHLRQRPGLPPFQVDHPLCAAAHMYVVDGGPGDAVFDGPLLLPGYYGEVDLGHPLDRLPELENSAFTLVGVGAVNAPGSELAHVCVILACNRQSLHPSAVAPLTLRLPDLGPVPGPEPARRLLLLLQQQRYEANLPLLLADPILCALMTLEAADAAGLNCEVPYINACVPVGQLGQLPFEPVLEDPRLSRIGVAVGPPDQDGRVRVIAAFAAD